MTRFSARFVMVLLLLSGTIFGGKKSAGQDNGTVAASYNRIGLTPLVLKPESISFDYSIQEAFQKMEIPEKFDNNKIRRLYIPATFPGATFEPAKESASEKVAKESTRSEKSSSEEGQIDYGSLANAAMREVSKGVTNNITRNFHNPLYDSILRHRLRENQVPHEVMDTLFNADEQGRYSMDELVERAKYNLTDAQATRLEASAKGLEQGAQDIKWANKVLTSNYIIGFYFNGIESFDDIYDKKGTPQDERIFTGYKGLVTAYLYRIDLNDSVRAVFYENCWAGKDADPEQLEKAKKARAEMEYPLVKEGSYQFEVESKRVGKKASSSRMKALFEGMADQTLKMGTKAAEMDVESFKVKTSLFEYDGFPIPFSWSKIGTKEGLEPDDRYFVYEYVQGSDGEVKKKRKGVLRATTKITKNDTVRPGNTEPSRFIQTAGWGLGKGMLLEQNPDMGLGLSLGWLNHGPEARFFNARLEVRVSKLLKISPGWYLYGDAGLHVHPDLDEDEFGKVNVMRAEGSATYDSKMQSSGVGAGLSKEFYFMNHFQIAPYLGFRRENTKFLTDSLHSYVEKALGESYGEAWTVDLGARLGVNLTYWLKLTGSFGLCPLSYSSEVHFFGPEVHPEVNTTGSELNFPDLDAGDSNPFHQARNPYKWDIMLRAVF